MHLIIEVLCSGNIIKVTAYEEEDRKDFIKHIDVAIDIEKKTDEYAYATYSIPMLANPISKHVVRMMCNKISVRCGRTIEEITQAENNTKRIISNNPLVARIMKAGISFRESLQLKNKMMNSILILNDNPLNNIDLSSTNAKSLNAVEVILYHELTYTSAGKLLLLERDYSLKLAKRARELSSRLSDQKIVKIFNILNLNPGIPQNKSSSLRRNSIATFKTFLEDNDHPQNIIDLLLMPDEKWDSFLTKIVEFTDKPSQNLTNFIYDGLFETQLSGQPNANYELYFGKGENAPLREGKHVMSESALNKPNVKTRRGINKFKAQLNSALTQNPNLLNKIALVYALSDNETFELNKIGMYAYFRNTEFTTEINQISHEFFIDLGKLLVPKSSTQKLIAEGFNENFRRNFKYHAKLTLSLLKTITENNEDEIISLKTVISLPLLRLKFLARVIPLLKESQEKIPNDLLYPFNFSESDFEILLDNFDDLCILINELTPLDEDHTDEQKLANNKQKIAFWDYLTKNTLISDERQKFEALKSKQEAPSFEVKTLSNMMFLKELLLKFLPSKMLMHTPHECYYFGRQTFVLVDSKDSGLLLKVIAKIGIKRIVTLKNIFGDSGLNYLDKDDRGLLLNLGSQSDTPSSSSISELENDHNGSQAQMDTSEDEPLLDFTNSLSIKYQRYVEHSCYSLWDFVEKELMSFVKAKYQQNPNLNSMKELEKITIENEQGVISPEQAVFNILDKHFKDIEKVRLKRKAEGEELKAMLPICKRARISQSQTVFDRSDVGTSASHAASGSSS